MNAADGQASVRSSIGMVRGCLALALVGVLVGCTAVPASPSPGASGPSPLESTALSPSATPSPTLAVPTATPTEAPTAPPPSLDPAVHGSFEVLPTAPLAGFDASIVCDGEIGRDDPVAIVWLEKPNGDRGDLVLRNYADVANPRTVCTFPRNGPRVVQLIDPRHVVIAGANDEAFAVVDLPEVHYRWFALPDESHSQRFISIGPELDRVVWKTEQFKPAGGKDRIHVTTAGGDEVLAVLPDANAGRCGQPTDSSQGGYTRSGSSLYILNQPTLTQESLLIFRGAEERLSILPPPGWWKEGRQPVFALWSPTAAALYWSQGGDVWRWTPDAGRQRFLEGVTWWDPTISADGRYLAYAERHEDGGRDGVYLVDLVDGGGPRRIGNGDRGEPRFLNATQLWLQASNGGGCAGPMPPGTWIYDVSSGQESDSIIASVVAAWPATSSQD